MQAEASQGRFARGNALDAGRERQRLLPTSEAEASQGRFLQAQILAVVVAMVFNFYLNNTLTYRDQKLQGWRWWVGLIKFMATCGIGAIANVGIANAVYDDFGGWIVSSLAGILVGFGWNYGATALLVWPKRRPKPKVPPPLA